MRRWLRCEGRQARASKPPDNCHAGFVTGAQGPRCLQRQRRRHDDHHSRSHRAGTGAVAPAVRLAGVTKDFGQMTERARRPRHRPRRSPRARSWPSSAPTAPARPPPSTWCSASPSRPAGEVERARPPAARRRSRAASSRRSCRPAGCSRTSPCARPSRYTASLFADTEPVDDGAGHAPASPASPTARSASAPAASSSGSGSRWPCSPTPRSCCSTSRPPAWTSRAAAPSGPRSARTPSRGRTVLFATHYLEEADQYADRIVLISQRTDRGRRHRQPRSRR